MKKWTLIFSLLITGLIVNAQKTTGEIHYKQTIPLQIELSEENAAFAAFMPNEIVNNMVLIFNKNESLYKKGEKQKVEETKAGLGGDTEVIIEFDGLGGGKDENYYNRKEKTTTSQRSMFGETFLVEGELERMKWKLVPEQKKILGYTCQKAEIKKDSSLITAWFTMEIPVSAGPESYNGLPGAILLLEQIEKGKLFSTIEALKVELKEIEAIKKPTKGKKVTEEEYEEIMKEFMEDMKKSSGSKKGNRTGIIIMD